MKITVAICTWNRARLLDQTLAEMHRLRIPAGIEWELLIVNNNCTDDTSEVIGNHVSHLPVRALFEPRQGHSHARNCALANTTGDVLVFSDDDVLVDPGWLESYAAVIPQWPDAVFFGGPVEPWFEVQPPRWIRRHFDKFQTAYALRHYGDATRWLAEQEIPVGANMAFRTEVIRRYEYDPQLGRLGKELRGGDEAQVFRRLVREGYRGVWVSNARLRHYIPRERLTMAYLWKWYYWESRIHTRLDELPPCKYLWGAPRWAIRRYLSALVQFYGGAPFKGTRWLKAFFETARWRALIDEARSQHRSPADRPDTQPSQGVEKGPVKAS
jgi:glycosyltransferase involved in cell wall biosynthesis